MVVRVFDLIGSPLAVASDDGQKVYDRIAALLHQDHKVSLSFAGVEITIGAFLNAAIGQLYGKFSEDAIGNLFSVREMSPEDLVLLKHTVENAKLYVSHQKEFDQAWREEIDGGRE
jgi:hypothetical protein